jgi:hypothetical protein
LEAESAAVHEDAPKKNAAVKPVRALKQRYRDRHLAVRRRGQPKERNQGTGDSRKKLRAASREMTRHAGVGWRKGHGRQGQGKDKGVRGTSNGRRLGKRQRTLQKGSNGIRDRDVKNQLRLRKERRSANSIRGRSRRQDYVWEA